MSASVVELDRIDVGYHRNPVLHALSLKIGEAQALGLVALTVRARRRRCVRYWGWFVPVAEVSGFSVRFLRPKIFQSRICT